MRPGVAISGTRRELTSTEELYVLSVVGEHVELCKNVDIHVGCAGGVDRTIRETYPGACVFTADWDGLGNKAGPMRNRAMLKSLRASHGVKTTLLAFPDADSHAGTLDCIKQAIGMGIKVKVFPLKDSE